MIGVAKSRFRTATHAVPVVRGSSARPLYVTAAGMPTADAANLVRRMAGRYRLPRPALRRYPRAHGPARSHHDRPPARLTYPDARYAAEARILSVGMRCINMQARAAACRADPRGPPGGRHSEGPFDNRAPTRLTHLSGMPD